MSSSTQSPDDKLNELAKSIQEDFNQIKEILNLKENPNVNRAEAILALIYSVFYRSNCLCIDWDLIRQYWLKTADVKISDTDFAELQRLFLTMRSRGDQFSSSFKFNYKFLCQNWLPNSGGWTKTFGVMVMTLPLLVIGIYGKVRDYPFGAPDANHPIPFGWPLLFRKGQDAQLIMSKIANILRENIEQIGSKRARKEAVIIFSEIQL